MKVAFIGDIVGKSGRNIIKEYLKHLKAEYQIDFVIANAENASHGFGLTAQNCDELLAYGVDCISGGNHSFDKKPDSKIIHQKPQVLRPHNCLVEYGLGVGLFDVADDKLAVINLMGTYGMPECENPFIHLQQLLEELSNNHIKNICIDFHAEATSEKAVAFFLSRGRASAICGTHTHVGTDDLQIIDGTFFVSDIGLTGCFDGVIGMDPKNPIKKALTNEGKHFDIPKRCEAILQMIVVEICDGKAKNGFKIKQKSSGNRAILSLW